MEIRIALSLLFFGFAASEVSFSQDAAHSSVLRLQQFVENPSLTAQSGQMVILDGPATDPDQAAIRYQLRAGNHEFCLDGNQPYFSGIVFEDAFGQEVLRHEGSPRCAKVDVPAGVYTVRISHEKSTVPKPNGVAQVSVDPLNPPLVDNTGDAIGGYWAVQPDPSDDYLNQNRAGRLTTNPSFAPFGSYSPFSQSLGTPFPTDGNFIQPEYGVTQMDQYSLFRFQYSNPSNLAAYYPLNGYLNRLYGYQGGCLGVSTCTCQNNICPIDNSGYPPHFDAQPFCQTPNDNQELSATLAVVDLGHYQFKLQYRGRDGTILDYQRTRFGFGAGNASIIPLRAELNDAAIPTGPLHVVFRFFPDGNVPPLQEGEVALYENCNYQGKAVVLGTPLANFLEWNSDVVTLDKLGASVQLGNNTAVTFYSGVNFTGSSQTEALNTACLASPPKVASIQLQSAEAVLVSTRKCLNCKLEGVDFSGVDLTEVDLTSAHMKDAVLAGTVLSHATLRQTDLSGAKLYGAILNNANLDGANLSGAYLTKPPSGDVPAATLQGAFLRNVNLSQAQLSGADFTNASFYGTIAVGTKTCTPDQNTGFTDSCATAAGAVMNNTQFSGAYLFGVDFTGAQIQGVQFANAALAGANFNKATILVDSSVGTNSGFSGAFLQGTNLATAESFQGISLADAFVDFSAQGNTMYLILSGYHTEFPGWHTPGQPVCAEMSYNGPPNSQQPLVPTNNSTITCPDELRHTNGCGPASEDGSNLYWKSPVDIAQFASYQFDATYTKAPASGTPICVYDPQWISGGVSRRRGRRPHPR